MKKKLLILLLAAAIFAVGNAYGQVVDLDDLNYWGTGSKRSALVVDWNDGTSNHVFAWGFLWDGTAPTVSEMLVSLTSLDAGIFLRLDSNASFGTAIFGVGYQTGAAPFGITGAQDPTGASVTPTFAGGIDDINITNGVTDSPSSSSGVAPLNAGDHYSEAWNTPDRYWALFLSGDDPLAFPSSATPSLAYPNWAEAGFGVSGVSIEDGAWYALSYSDPGYLSVAPGAALAAVPEPAAIGLVILGISSLLIFLRTHGSQKAS